MNRTLPKLAIVHCPAGGGHRAAAEALAAAHRARGGEAEVIDALAFAPAWFATAYVQTHLRSTSHVPWAYGRGYRRLDRRHPVADRVRRGVDRLVGARLAAWARELDADAIVSTHFFPLSVLGRERLRGRLALPVIGVVTDYAAHAFWAEPGVDLFCVATEGVAADLVRHGAPAGDIAVTGIPIREAFGAIDRRPIREGEPIDVLITSGGFGVGPMVDTIASFAGLGGYRLTIVCGRNVRREAEAREAALRTGLPCTVIGYEHDMPARIADAHVVIGKPGGLTTSEVVAAGRPLVCVGACPGQEKHNEDWLVVHGAAVASEAKQAGRRLEWLRRAGALGAMATASRQLGRPDAAARVASAVEGLLARAAAAA